MVGSVIDEAARKCRRCCRPCLGVAFVWLVATQVVVGDGAIAVEVVQVKLFRVIFPPKE